MLKIKNPASHSLGLRRSGGGVHRVAPLQQKATAPWFTMMHEAFLAATVKRSTGAAIINSCAKALHHNKEGMRMGKGWNAHLSFKTAQKLKEEGILV